MRASKEVYYLLGFLTIVIISLLTALIVVALSAKKGSNDNKICESEECVRSAALISSSMDTSVDPCDDFYQYACGNWQKDHPLPQNFESWSHFARLEINKTNNLENLLINTSEREVNNFLKPLITLFDGCTDMKARNKSGYTTLINFLKEIGGWPLIEDNWVESKYDWINALIVLNRKLGDEIKIFLTISVESDIRNTSRNIIQIDHPFKPKEKIVGIFTHPEHRKITPSYYDDSDLTLEKIAELLKGSPIKQYSVKAQAIKSIANKLKESVTQDNLLNPVITVQQLINTYKGIDWMKLLKGIFQDTNIEINLYDLVQVTDHNYLIQLSNLINSQKKENIANYIGSIAVSLIELTTQKAMDLIKPNQYKMLNELCFSISSQLFPDLIGRLYVDNLFDKESMGDMRSLVNDLKKAFNELLNENNWMDPITKANAISKLNAMAVNIASPDFTFNDSELQLYSNDYKGLDNKDFLKSVLIAKEIKIKNQLKYLRSQFPKRHWPESASAAMVNAFYYPSTNAIYFPAAIAQFPFYQRNGLLTTNIGAIGAVIGHEMTHGFDNKGGSFDSNGNYANWWTNSSEVDFSKKSQCFIDQYNRFDFEGIQSKVNGTQTLAENIADNGGVREAFRALQIMKKRNELNKLPGKMSKLSDEQIFFLSYANIWCSNPKPEAIENQIDTDAHSPERFRVLGTLSNFDEFSKAFNCKIGSNMNKNSNKCQLW